MSPFLRNKNLALHGGVLLFFAASAFLQLLPLSLHPADGLNDEWDCLLNTWILGWNHHQLAKNPLHLFETNAFFPHRSTLSYSETLLPLAVLSWPVAALSRNPILAYNFVFFLSCILNAYAMFLLVRHLTGRAWSGVAAGLVFAFSAVLMQQITHLQLVAAWFLPLALLSLHRFFETGRTRHSVLFALFLTLQALSCVYYGLFFLSLLPLILAVMLMLNRKSVRPVFLLRLGLPLLCAGAALFAYARPFLRLFHDFHFQRNLEYGAALQNYLAVPPNNRLWGSLLHPLGSYEYFLFPGAVALLSAVFFIFWKFLRSGEYPHRLKVAMMIVLSVPATLTLTLLLSGGFKIGLGSLMISLTNPAKQAYLFMVGLGTALILFFVLYLVKSRGDRPGRGAPFLYLFLMFGALSFSFGAAFSLLGSRVSGQFSTFSWLYKYIPGFKGIRVPSRYAAFVILAVAVLAGFGFDLIFRKLKKRSLKVSLAVLLLLVINAEYWSYPQRLRTFPVGGDIPPTYRWLAQKPEDFAILELPLAGGVENEAVYMYLSLFHKKKIVNGYSGFLPPTIDALRSLFRDFPSQASLETLQQLGVKYVVFHAKRLPPERAEDIRFDVRHRAAPLLREAVTFRYGFSRPNDLVDWLGDDTIYEVLPPLSLPAPPLADIEIPSSSWGVESSLNSDSVRALKDGLRETSWSTERPKARGEILLISFDKPTRISRISLDAGPVASGAAGNLVARWSLDGRSWEVAQPGFHAGVFIRSLIDDPKHAVQDIFFQGEEVRFIKIEQTGVDPLWPWSVAEIRVFRVSQAP